MLERAVAAAEAQGVEAQGAQTEGAETRRAEAGARPKAAPEGAVRSAAGAPADPGAATLPDLFQIPAEQAVRRYAELLAAYVQGQREVTPADPPAPRAAKETAAGGFARAFSSVAPAADRAVAGAPAPAQPSPAAAPVEAPLTPQIVKAVSLLWRDGIGEARIRLEPEHLGSVTVSLRVERGIVTARMAADTPAVRDWIRTHEAELRNSLAGQGLELDRIVVSADPDERHRQSAPEPRGQLRPPRALREGRQFELRA